MNVTEAEAKTKWCPFARGSFVMVGNSPASVNRNLSGEASSGASCIGSDCMAWRWNAFMRSNRVHPDVVKNYTERGLYRQTDAAPDAQGFVEVVPDMTKQTGSCGLVGDQK